VHVARDGVHLSCFEPPDPGSVRWGSTPHAFDLLMEEAGSTDRGDTRPGAACASFLHLLTGLVLTPTLVEDPLLCATLPVWTSSVPAS
jgi:hypothetical protein